MEQVYQTILSFIKGKPILKNIIVLACEWLPKVTMIIYGYVLVNVFIYTQHSILKVICIPAIAFLITTVFRKLYNRRRPYEKYAIEPLFMHKSGESFPSRHTTSAVVIALVSFTVSFPVGIITSIVAFLIGVLRVCSGVHYISDVLAGAGVPLVVWYTWAILF